MSLKEKEKYMRILQKTKDGGPESTVDAYFLFEFKKLFSIALLKFNKGSRNNYHSHAFNALTWFLWGYMDECRLLSDGRTLKHREYRRSLIPKFTSRDNMHKVYAHETSWVLTIRGPWSKTWEEYDPTTNQVFELSHGREIISTKKMT